MISTAPELMVNAKSEIEKSNEEVNIAFDHLQEKIKIGYRNLDGIVTTSKKVLTLTTLTCVVGLFLGQVIRLSMRQRRHKLIGK